MNDTAAASVAAGRTANLVQTLATNAFTACGGYVWIAHTGDRGEAWANVSSSGSGEAGSGYEYDLDGEATFSFNCTSGRYDVYGSGDPKPTPSAHTGRGCVCAA